MRNLKKIWVLNLHHGMTSRYVKEPAGCGLLFQMDAGDQLGYLRVHQPYMPLLALLIYVYL